MPENGRKSTVVISVITSIIMVLIVGLSTIYTIHNDKTEQIYQENQNLSKIKRQVSVLQSRIQSQEQKYENICTRIDKLESTSSDLRKQLGVITEILNRLDKRTKRLQDFIYSEREKN